MSDKRYSGKAALADLQARVGAVYPVPFDEPCKTREKIALGNAVGLSQFGVNLLVLNPGDWSAQRHWHSNEDEFVYVLEGEVTLVTDEGESLLKAGEFAGFSAGQPNGHHLINKGSAIAKIFEVGSRAQNETVLYSDVDLMATSENGTYRFFRKNGEPYK